MLKAFLMLFIIPFGCLAQSTISGKIINQVDTKPVANARVFLSNATNGTKTANDGTFSLHNVQPGKYVLVISIIGFESYSQDITVGHIDVELPVITIFPKTTALKQVTIHYHHDPDRDKYLDWFKDEFLGTSTRSKECKILNPELIDLSYDEANHKLTASSADYLTIENDALGYKIRYLVTDFSLDKQSETEKKIFYKGPVQFEELPGTPSQQKRWAKNRQELYENSPMHFLRAALNNTLDEEGFRVQKEINTVNPDRQPDSLINEKINFFKRANKRGEPNADDSLSAWTKMSKLPKAAIKTITLNSKDIIRTTDQEAMYAMVDGGGKTYVAYSKTRHFRVKNSLQALYNANNDENTLVAFNSPAAFFYGNGVIINPYSVTYYGVWGKNRVAEMLPIDYSPGTNIEHENIIAQNITAKLDTFITRHPTEKAYLQFDKPFYAAGDTIYFKAYVITGGEHKLSTLSGVLHVDLINPDNKINRSIKLQLDNGLTWGDFVLPDSLLKGNYVVRAYTNLMRLNDTLVSFNKTIPVGALQAKRIPESIVKPLQGSGLKPDIQFFPEGGGLVIGVRSKVAFKAVGPDGSGVFLSGVVQESTGKEVATFSSLHLGMGYFYLTPETGKTYTAKLTYNSGIQDVVNLPKPEDQITLSAENGSDEKIPLTINAGKDYFEKNKNKEFAIVILSDGTINTLNFKLENAAVKLNIEKSKLRTGIATITVFSSACEPMCERLIFINNNDQLKLKINGDKDNYASREKVKVTFSAHDFKDFPAEGHFSVAVTNETLVPDKETKGDNILTHFLLTSELKGYVEQPAYYFSDTSARVKNDLDVLMLTQGYRKFEWKKILSENQLAATIPERELEVSGMVKSLLGKPIVNGNVTLLKPGAGMLTSPTDDKGIFHFSNLIFTDTARFILSAVNAAGENSTKLKLFPEDTEPVIPINKAHNEPLLPDSIITPYLNNFKNNAGERLRYSKSILLREVKIKEKKLDNHYETQSLVGAGNADQVVHSKDMFNAPTLSDALNGLLHGITFNKIGNATVANLAGFGAMLLVLDGVALRGSPGNPPDLNMINVSEVETVEVLKYANSSIYGMDSGHGVLIITTKKGGGMRAEDIVSVGILPVKVVGFYKAKEFYSPKYNNPSQTAKQHDFRSTIYWQPEIKTDDVGNASFEYYNADATGTYKVTIEGIDNNGNIGRQVLRYNVN